MIVDVPAVLRSDAGSLWRTGWRRRTRVPKPRISMRDPYINPSNPLNASSNGIAVISP